jgi:SAM-dependent methyltransferase
MSTLWTVTGEQLAEVLRREAFLGPLDAALERDVRLHAERCARIVDAVRRFAPERGEAPLDVLEVGLGSGYVAAALRHALGDRLRLHAVDHPDRPAARDPALRAELAARGITFEPLDLAAGPVTSFAGVDFDVVVLSEVIEHLSPPDVPGVLRGLGQRLAGDGVLVVTSPNLRSFHRRVSFALGGGRLFDPPTPLPEADGTLGHVRLYARFEVEELAGAAGLRIAHWAYADWEAGFIASPLLRGGQRTAARLAPALGTAWLAVLRRF